MTARAYYNEFDSFAAQWLRNLIDAGLIPAGDVDERSIVDVRPSDLDGYTQCHFFAGIGGWPYALRLAGWPDDKPVWTGSCPCQPLSSAGQRKGHADERHLWPAFYGLIAKCRPATVFGEQVASIDGREWLAAVRADLEGLGYAIGAADLCAAGIGAPHIRQRLFWVADAGQVVRGRGADKHGPSVAGQAVRLQKAVYDQRGGTTGRLADANSPRRHTGLSAAPPSRHGGTAGSDGGTVGMGHTIGAGLEIQHRQPGNDGPQQPSAERAGQAVGGMAYAAEPRWGERPPWDGRADWRATAEPGRLRDAGRLGDLGWPGAHHGGWGDADWLFCTDGRWRPVEPGSFPLAHGVPGRVGRLRAYGNAIVPQVAATFISTVMETTHAA